MTASVRPANGTAVAATTTAAEIAAQIEPRLVMRLQDLAVPRHERLMIGLGQVE